MKLRIKGNSIRLRLSQTEVRIFCETKIFQQAIQFGPSSTDIFNYSLEIGEGSNISAMYGMDQMHVFIPETLAMQWCNTELISLSHEQTIEDSDEMLTILVEKDYTCLVDRPDEDESDNYPNPKSEGES